MGSGVSDAWFFFIVAAVCFIGVGLLRLKYTVTRNRLYRRRIGILHGPGPVLVMDSSWRTWNGIYISFPTKTLWIEVR